MGGGGDIQFLSFDLRCWQSKTTHHTSEKKTAKIHSQLQNIVQFEKSPRNDFLLSTGACSMCNLWFCSYCSKWNNHDFFRLTFVGESQVLVIVKELFSFFCLQGWVQREHCWCSTKKSPKQVVITYKVAALLKNIQLFSIYISDRELSEAGVVVHSLCSRSDCTEMLPELLMQSAMDWPASLIN